MKTPKQIFEILKKAFLDEKFSLDLDFSSYDSTERHDFKQNNFNVCFMYSYNADTVDLNNGDYLYPGDKKTRISNINVSDIEIVNKGVFVELEEEMNEELEEILKNVLINENT